MLQITSRLLLPIGVVFLAAPARAQSNACDMPGDAPDVVIGHIGTISRWGVVDGVTAFSLGTDTCNLGTCQLEWMNGSPNHPVIGQNLFRLKNGRFEQIGQSWVKHASVAFQGSLCGVSCMAASGGYLGINCSDAYGSILNGTQTALGPKSEVQPRTGVHAHPYTTQGQTGNAVYKRLQVANADLDPALNAAALYFGETQAVARDDAASGNVANNASYRAVSVSVAGSDFNLSLQGATVRGQPAIRAWATIDPSVQIADIASELVGAVKVTPSGFAWQYEYALQNLTSSDGVQSFRVPIPRGAIVSNIGFHDVPYHSGETYSGTDWTMTIDTTSDPNTIVWSTQTFAENPNANALRWGTLYNFRFEVNAAPVPGDVALAAFQPGGMNRLWSALVPDRCGDGFCDSDEDEVGCLEDCSSAEGAGAIGTSLQISRLPDGQLVLEWGGSCAAADDDFAIYEGTDSGFASPVWRLCSTDGANTATIMPDSAALAYYLVVPTHGTREGSYGRRGDGTERPQAQSPCHERKLVSCGP